MKKLRIKGLRSLKDTGLIRIAPITVLLGENSSGKSTFLRTFPLLRQSVEVRTSEPLLWYGRLVDFGSFEESVSAFLEKKEVEIQLAIDFDPNAYLGRHALIDPFSFSSENVGPAESTVILTVSEGPKGPYVSGEKKIASFVKRLRVELWACELELEFAGPSELSRVTIDGKDFTETAKATYGVMKTYSPTPTLYKLRSTVEEEASNAVGPARFTFSQEIHSHVKNLVHNRTKDDSIDGLTERIRLGKAADMQQAIKSSQADVGVWRKQVATWTEETSDFVTLRRLLWGVRLEAVLDALSETLRREFQAISYITPLRAAAERYYRQQGLAVNELDAKGENFALFLRSLSYEDQESLRRWLSSALGVYVRLEESRGHVSLYLTDSRTH